MPGRIASRGCAKRQPIWALIPNVWFGNVELVAAKDIGQETVTYVSNIYKYYIAYKLAVRAAADPAEGERIAGELMAKLGFGDSFADQPSEKGR